MATLTNIGGSAPQESFLSAFARGMATRNEEERERKQAEKDLQMKAEMQVMHALAQTGQLKFDPEGDIKVGGSSFSYQNPNKKEMTFAQMEEMIKAGMLEGATDQFFHKWALETVGDPSDVKAVAQQKAALQMEYQRNMKDYKIVVDKRTGSTTVVTRAEAENAIKTNPNIQMFSTREEAEGVIKKIADDKPPSSASPSSQIGAGIGTGIKSLFGSFGPAFEAADKSPYSLSNVGGNILNSLRGQPMQDVFSPDRIKASGGLFTTPGNITDQIVGGFGSALGTLSSLPQHRAIAQQAGQVPPNLVQLLKLLSTGGLNQAQQTGQYGMPMPQQQQLPMPLPMGR